MNTGLLLFAAVFAGTLYFGEAVRCYNCFYSGTFDSKSNPNCNEGAAFNAANASGNSINILECVGSCSKFRAALGSSITIQRDCLSTCPAAMVAGYGMACCKTDLCNAAWRMTPTSVTLAPAIALLVATLIRG